MGRRTDQLKNNKIL